MQGDDASAQHAQEQQADMPHADDAALEEAQPQICVTADVSKVNAVAAAPKDAADEPVSDTDDDIEGMFHASLCASSLASS